MGTRTEIQLQVNCIVIRVAFGQDAEPPYVNLLLSSPTLDHNLVKNGNFRVPVGSGLTLYSYESVYPN